MTQDKSKEQQLSDLALRQRIYQFMGESFESFNDNNKNSFALLTSRIEALETSVAGLQNAIMAKSTEFDERTKAWNEKVETINIDQDVVGVLEHRIEDIEAIVYDK